MWWPGAITTSDYQQSLQSHHQHLLNQQLVVQQQQQQQAVAQQQAQHDTVARSTAAATQQLFTYKMASSFQNPATTMTSASVSSSSPVASCMRGYDYRLGDGMVGGGSGGMVGAGGRPGDASLASSAAPQWWYPSGMGSPIQNVPTPPAVVCILPLVARACVYVCKEGEGNVYVSPLAVVYAVFLVVCVSCQFVWTIVFNRQWQSVCVYVKYRVEGARCLRRSVCWIPNGMVNSMFVISAVPRTCFRILNIYERNEAIDHWQYCSRPCEITYVQEMAKTS